MENNRLLQILQRTVSEDEISEEKVTALKNTLEKLSSNLSS